MPVHIEPDLFVSPGEWEPTPEFYLTVTDDVEAAMRALSRAGERMICTDEAGVEHPDYEAANAGGEFAPPHAVWDPVATPTGIAGYVDCQASVFPDQAATFRAILRQELEAVGVTATVRNMTGDEMKEFWRQL